MELNKINSTGSWGKASDDLNQNFSKVNNAVEQIKNATTRNKGYFSSDAELKSAFPSANMGDIAYVGSAYPYQTWSWNGTEWEKKNDAGGEESVNLGNYYTKNETDGKFTETDAKLSELGSKIRNIPIENDEDEEFYIIDRNGNIAFYISKDGVGALKYNIYDKNGNVIKSINKEFIDSILNDIETLNSIQSFSDYLMLVPNDNTIPALNTKKQTLTLKSGSWFLGVPGINIQLTEDIVVTQPTEVDGSKYWSHYVVINENREVRLVGFDKQVNLIKGKEGVICLVRWNTAVVRSGFFKYSLNETIIKPVPTMDVEGEIEELKNNIVKYISQLEKETAELGSDIRDIPIENDGEGCFTIIDRNGHIVFSVSEKGIKFKKACVEEITSEGEELEVTDKDGNIAFSIGGKGVNFTPRVLGGSILLESYIVDNRIVRYNTSLSLVGMIKSWGFIGGSTTSGEAEYTKDDGSVGYEDLYEYSIGQQLCKINGVEGYNFSQGGQSAYGWCSGTTSRTWEGAKKTENLKQAYIIDLGANDLRMNIPLGSPQTDVDLTNYNNNVNSIVGWYVGVIQRLRSVNPKCYIFLLTSRNYMYPNSGDYVKKIIPMIYDVYDYLKSNGFERIYIVDNNKLGIQHGAAYQNVLMSGGHPSTIGYHLEGYVINTLIDQVIRENLEDFKEVGFVLTDKTRR